MSGTSRGTVQTQPSSTKQDGIRVANAREKTAQNDRAVAQENRHKKEITALQRELAELAREKRRSDAAKTAAEKELNELTQKKNRSDEAKTAAEKELDELTQKKNRSDEAKTAAEKELAQLAREKRESEAAKTAAEKELQKKVNEIEGLQAQVEKNEEKMEESEKEKRGREEMDAVLARGDKLKDELQRENTVRKELIGVLEQIEKIHKEKTDLISEEWKLPEYRTKMQLSREKFKLELVDTFLLRIQYVGTEQDESHGLDERHVNFLDIIGAHFVRGGMVLHYKTLHKKLRDYIVFTLASTKQGGDVDTSNLERGKARILEKEYESITLIDKQLRRKLSQGEWCSLKFYTGDSDLEETEISRSVKLAFLLFEGDGEADSRFFRQYDYCTRKLARSALSGQVDMRDNRVQTFNAEIRTADNNLKQLLGTLSEVARIIQHECRYASELVNQDLRALNVMMEDYQEQKLAVTKLIYSSIMLPISRIIVLLFLAKHFPVEITQEVWSEEIVFKLLNPMEHSSSEGYNLKAPDHLDEDAASIYNCILLLLHSDRSPVGRGDGTGESSLGDHSE